MNDSGVYVGACLRQCDVAMNHMWMENNALGYSGTNSGGTIVIENSQFDGNQDGLDTNTAVVGDPPAPQDGRCPNGGVSPITRTISCWVVIHNYIHDNNSATVPAAGSAAAGPIGTGLTISGGRYDTVMDNTIVNNGAWGVLFVPYAQQGTPSLAPDLHRLRRATGAGLRLRARPRRRRVAAQHVPPQRLLRQPEQLRFRPDHAVRRRAANCFARQPRARRQRPGQPGEDPATCGGTTTAGNNGGVLFPQVLCDTGLARARRAPSTPSRTAPSSSSHCLAPSRPCRTPALACLPTRGARIGTGLPATTGGPPPRAPRACSRYPR